MVLGGQPPGRVGHCQGAFLFNLKKNNPNENISTLLGQLNLPSEMFIGIFIGFLIFMIGS